MVENECEEGLVRKMDDFQVYDTVIITVSNGTEKEFAIMEEFDFEGKHYIVVSPVEDNAVQEGLYIYRAKVNEDELEVSCIEDAEEFQRVSSYYESL